MNKVLVLVEGETEEQFINSILSPYLAANNLYLVATQIRTRQDRKRGKIFKGGGISYQKVENDIKRLLNDTSAVCVTTMLDFCDLPPEFPGFTEQNGTPQQRVEFMEEAFGQKINNSRFLPYFSLHEFEALLFVSPEKIDEAFPDRDHLLQVVAIKNQFPIPEDINKENTPSARLEAIYTIYKKPFHGRAIAEEIGIDQMRQQCPHFDAWLQKLENLR